MLYKIILNHFVCRHLLKTKCRQINYFCEKNRIKNNKNNALQDILKLLCLATFAILAFFGVADTAQNYKYRQVSEK